MEQPKRAVDTASVLRTAGHVSLSVSRLLAHVAAAKPKRTARAGSGHWQSHSVASLRYWEDASNEEPRAGWYGTYGPAIRCPTAAVHGPAGLPGQPIGWI